MLCSDERGDNIARGGFTKCTSTPNVAPNPVHDYRKIMIYEYDYSVFGDELIMITPTME